MDERTRYDELEEILTATLNHCESITDTVWYDGYTTFIEEAMFKIRRWHERHDIKVGDE